MKNPQIPMEQMIRNSLWNWYPYAYGSKMLCIEQEEQYLSDHMRTKGLEVSRELFGEIEINNKKYDYIICADTLESIECPGAYIKKCMSGYQIMGYCCSL